VERPLVAGTVAKKDDGDFCFTAIFQCQGGAGTDRDAAAGDAVGAKKIIFHAAEVLRATTPTAIAIELAKQFAHDAVGIESAS